MKNKIFQSLEVIGIAALSAMLLMVGCRTTETITKNPDGTSTTNTVQTVDTNKVQKLAQLTARAGASIAATLSKRPELVPQFKAAADAVDVLLLNGNYDPESVRQALRNINVETSDELFLIGSTFLDAYGIFAGDVVGAQLDKTAWLRPVLRGLVDGLREASIGIAVPVTPPTP
jgi:hypothetical protein